MRFLIYIYIWLCSENERHGFGNVIAPGAFLTGEIHNGYYTAFYHHGIGTKLTIKTMFSKRIYIYMCVYLYTFLLAHVKKINICRTGEMLLKGVGDIMKTNNLIYRECGLNHVLFGLSKRSLIQHQIVRRAQLVCPDLSDNALDCFIM